MQIRDIVAVGLLGAGAAVVGGAVAGVLSGTLHEFFNWRRRPILVIDFQDCSVKQPGSPFMTHAPWEEEGQQRQWVTARARVRNHGKRTAKHCQVYLVALQEVREGKARPAGFYDSLSLPWAGSDFDPRDLPRDVHAFIDVVRFRKDVMAWNFTFRVFSGDRTALNGYSGTYRFRLVATAENAATAFCEIAVDYRKDWNNLRAWRVS